MKEHNYASQTLQNEDTSPRLQSRTQNICFVISISAVILKLMVKITSIFGSYKFLRIAWHDIFTLSHHLLASWNLYIPRVERRRANAHLLVKFNSWTSQRLLIWNPIPKYSSERLLRVLNLLRPLTVLWKICRKENSESGQRTIHALRRVFIWVVPVAMHSGKK